MGPRQADYRDRYATIAGELVTANVDVIVAAGPTIDAVRRATSKIPIVMVGGAVDPVDTNSSHRSPHPAAISPDLRSSKSISLESVWSF